MRTVDVTVRDVVTVLAGNQSVRGGERVSDEMIPAY
jgi:hypothetical protein